MRSRASLGLGADGSRPESAAQMPEKLAAMMFRSDLTAMINRLEAATSRLEDMASSTMEPVQKPQSTALAAATASAAAAAAAGGQPAQVPTPPTVPKAPVKTVEPLPESIEEFDAFLQTAVKRYLGLSAELSGPVAEQVSILSPSTRPKLTSQALHVSKAFDAQRKFLLITTKAKKPDVKSQDYAKLLEPLTTEIGAVAEVREKNRGSQFANQLSAVADSIGVLGWVTVDRQPFKHVEEMLSSAQYFGNRVLKEFKDK
jgi:adenylyl cyclase-associated protein